MIQRIQSIYLFLASIFLILTLFFKMSSYTIVDKTYNLTSFGINYETKEFFLYPVYLPLILGAILAFLCIFLYKNRKLQLRLNQFNYLIIIVSIVFLFLNYHTIEKAIVSDKSQITYGIGMFLPLCALVCTFLANRGIKKDEQLISSLDRLR